MSKIMTILADAEALLALQPEDLGLILLNLVQQERKKMVTRSEFEMPLWNANSPNYPHQKRDFVGRAFAEAWQWLENEGLLMSEPTQSGGYYCLTRKGAALKSSADVDAYRHGNVLHPALLHPTLAEKVRPMFLRGDYDVAVFQAFKEVEVAVRKAGRCQTDAGSFQARERPSYGP